jgi:RND family efflux transporter MFP subunit
MQSARPEDIRRTEAALAAAKSKLLEATASFRRYQRLYQNNNISKAEYDQARAARDVAEAEVMSAEESLTIAKTGARPEDIEAMDARIRAMEADLRKARDQLDDTELRAPYDGKIAERYVDNFEYVTAFTDILSLQDIRVVEIVAQLPEGVVSAKKHTDYTFSASFASAPGVKLPAEITEVATVADPVTRTYDVTFQTKQPREFQVFAGMTAEIEISGTTGMDSGFLVPVTAIFGDDAGNKNVWLLEEGSNRVRQAAVELGEPSGDEIWVVSGLEPGNRVVTAGTHFLSEDQRVRPINDELRDRK